MKTYNKGEWSELYAICKMLYDQAVDVCDSNLEPIDQKIKILKLLMRSIEGSSEYDVDSKPHGNISIIYNGKVIKNAFIDKDVIKAILDEIVSGSGSSFSVPSGDGVMDELLLESFKANSYQKADVDTVSIMPQESSPRNVSFSIKSQIGNPPTLLNASQSTNFIYKVTGFTGSVDDVNSINTRSKVKDRMSYIFEHNGEFEFYEVQNEIFEKNLRMTDSMLPEIMGDLLMVFFVGNGVRTVRSLIDSRSEFFEEPSKNEVLKKVKDFLCNITLGMIPTEEWDGSELGGGCIFVKNDGNLVCFTLYDMEAFKNYLVDNTRFDTPSTTKFKFGELYKGENDNLFFKLCLDVRFLH